ncbi:MAG: sigma-70 family RNA polymerase sigma factor [Oscillospiraceae bacterium]|nr:sigma-70 family RNA polymerase sigma factor [Oscillospiraceae bacterium]
MSRNDKEQARQYQLVQRCLHGDGAARDELFLVLYRYLHDKLAFSLKKQCTWLSWSDMEDIISLTITKCLEDLALFENRSCLTTWAFQYGFNFARNANRKNHTYYRHHLYFDPQRHVDRAGADPLELYIQKERNEAVYKAFENLCALHRQLLIWVLFQNRSFFQIAQALHHPPDHIRQLYLFACQSMRRNFRCFYYHEPYVSARLKNAD